MAAVKQDTHLTVKQDTHLTVKQDTHLTAAHSQGQSDRYQALQDYVAVLLTGPLAAVQQSEQGGTQPGGTGSSGSGTRSTSCTLLVDVLVKVLGKDRVPHLAQLQRGFVTQGTHHFQSVRQSLHYTDNHPGYPKHLDWLRQEVLWVLSWLLREHGTLEMGAVEERVRQQYVGRRLQRQQQLQQRQPPA
jgi:hypothetical protein